MIDKTKLFFGKNRSAEPQASFIQTGFALDEEPKIEYIWSNNPNYIKQYAKIIDEQFDTELNLNDIYKTISADDFRSHYRLFMAGEKVVGGFRMIINDPLREYSLPSEKPGFTFKDTFKELDLLNNKYTELSRFAVLPGFRNNMLHYKDGFRAYNEKMTELGIKYLFLCSSRSRFRVYNRFAVDYFKLVSQKHVDASGWQDKYKDLEFYVCAYENQKI